jgi:hypothetical protein
MGCWIWLAAYSNKGFVCDPIGDLLVARRNCLLA